MCGINGFSWRDRSLIEKMNGCLEHRGPDDQSTYLDDNVSLGHRRLAIIDLSPAGKQPMANEDGTIWIVFNGEIYNFGEIRKDLEERGHRFSSRTDTEVIVHSYEEWGQDCIEKFNGMWAFAIYDKNKDLLFLSRDRFGVKPLYYCKGKRGLIFSSEIKGILEHDVERYPDDGIVFEYLAFGLVNHRRETFFKNIYSLMPGENLIYDIPRGCAETVKWYDLNSRVEDMPEASEEELAEKVRNLFEDCIRHRLISDVPVGSCLSGGIDSSSIVCCMKNLVKGNIIKTFSLVFPGLNIDESTYINEVIKNTGVESYRTSPTIVDLMEDLEDLVWTQEEPFGTLSIYGQYKVMQIARSRGMKVLLDGQGGDEIFAGYSIYTNNYLFECLKSGRLREFLKSVKPDFPSFVLASLMVKVKPLRSLLDKAERNRYKFLESFYKGDTSDHLQRKVFGLNNALRGDINIYMIPHLLRYEDKNSMRWSIESRVPFMDYRLVELAASLGSRYKVRDGITKYIFRRAMDGIVPQKILERSDKVGFATPDKIWFVSTEFMEMVKGILMSSKFKSRGYWRCSEVENLLKEHLEGKKDNSGPIWRIINMEIWLRIFIDREDEPRYQWRNN